MRINKITLKNFEQFESKVQEFSKLNFIQGSNGCGKTTLILESILFCFWGYAFKPLSDLPTRDKSKSCLVVIDFTQGKDTYTITRNYPTHVELIKNETRIKFATSTEANRYIETIVGTREHFMKFNLIDAYSKEADILSAGQTTIKKTLFSLTEGIFNNAKDKLQAIKQEREKFNKDGMTVFTHYPSEKRLTILKKGIEDITKQYRDIVKEVNEFDRDYNIENRDKGNCEGRLSTCKSNKNKLLAKPKTCYTCNQLITPANKERQLTDITKEMEKLNLQIKEHVESLTMQKEIVSGYKEEKEGLNVRINALNHLKTRLTARLSQKNLIYDSKDILIVKTALSELDGLSSYYLKESIKTLTPIINSVLEKIGFTVNFTIDEKGKFTILYKKEGITYNQKDLSTGQATIMQIAFKLALLISMGETGIVVADEGLGSLDENNLNHIVELFSNYPFQLFMVLHRFNQNTNNVKVINLNEN